MMTFRRLEEEIKVVIELIKIASGLITFFASAVRIPRAPEKWRMTIFESELRLSKLSIRLMMSPMIPMERSKPACV